MDENCFMAQAHLEWILFDIKYFPDFSMKTKNEGICTIPKRKFFIEFSKKIFSYMKVEQKQKSGNSEKIIFNSSVFFHQKKAALRKEKTF